MPIQRNTEELAISLRISQRHARRLKAANDPRTFDATPPFQPSPPSPQAVALEQLKVGWFGIYAGMKQLRGAIQGRETSGTTGDLPPGWETLKPSLEAIDKELQLMANNCKIGFF